MLKRLQTYDKTARRGRSGDADRRGSKTEIRGASNSFWFSYITLIKIGGVQGRSQGGPRGPFSGQVARRGRTEADQTTTKTTKTTMSFVTTDDGDDDDGGR